MQKCLIGDDVIKLFVGGYMIVLLYIIFFSYFRGHETLRKRKSGESPVGLDYNTSLAYDYLDRASLASEVQSNKLIYIALFQALHLLHSYPASRRSQFNYKISPAARPSHILANIPPRRIQIRRPSRIAFHCFSIVCVTRAHYASNKTAPSRPLIAPASSGLLRHVLMTSQRGSTPSFRPFGPQVSAASPR
ncbi:hypothetical protein Zmor_005641 [Zophobas morio]|uniref:Uncharacterized protein n=1 Tax=Zophobas morio TaxID=2755281 RepID=A0AA38MKV5_9CUCU|nr:hypothetical protein Zmor_005641 [Zophobas morio]